MPTNKFTGNTRNGHIKRVSDFLVKRFLTCPKCKKEFNFSYEKLKFYPLCKCGVSKEIPKIIFDMNASSYHMLWRN